MTRYVTVSLPSPLSQNKAARVHKVVILMSAHFWTKSQSPEG